MISTFEEWFKVVGSTTAEPEKVEVRDFDVPYASVHGWIVEPDNEHIGEAILGRKISWDKGIDHTETFAATKKFTIKHASTGMEIIAERVGGPKVDVESDYSKYYVNSVSRNQV